jgi:hypothetical protein
LWTFCLVWSWTLILPILASHTTRIVVMSHWHMTFCLFPDFKRNVFNFYLVCKMLARRLWYVGFFVVRYSHSILSSFRDFYNELMLSSFKEFFCIYWGDFYCLFCLCAVLHVVIRICHTTLVFLKWWQLDYTVWALPGVLEFGLWVFYSEFL